MVTAINFRYLVDACSMRICVAIGVDIARIGVKIFGIATPRVIK